MSMNMNANDEHREALFALIQKHLEEGGSQ